MLSRCKYIGVFILVFFYKAATVFSSSEPKIVPNKTLVSNNPGDRNAVSIVRDGRPICTGSLIAPKIILTAGHCFNIEGNFQVFFGEQVDLEQKSKFRKVRRFSRLHSESKLFPFFDLAWLEFAGNPENGYHPLPILLNPHELTPGKEVIHVGYGKTGTFCEYDSPSTPCVGKKHTLTSRIRNFYSSQRIRHILVTNSNTDRGVCMGDSGGPVYINTEEGWQIAAIVSGNDLRLNPQAYQQGYVRCENGDASFTFAGFDINWLEKETGVNLSQNRQIFLADSYQEQIKDLEENKKVWLKYQGNAAAFIKECLTSIPGSEEWYTYEQLLVVAETFSCEAAFGVLNQVDSLNLNSKEITNLEPLRHLTRLQRLDLGKNNATSINALSNLNKLVQLDLSENKQLRSVSSLRHLPKLKQLDISHTKVNSLQSLCFTKLESLKIRFVKSWEKLIEESAECFDDSLRELDLSGVSMKKFSSHFQEFKVLQKLDVSHNKLHSLKGIPTNLRELVLDFNPLVDISSLTNVHPLHRLSIRYVQLDASSLPTLKNLHSLDISNTNIDSLSFVDNLPKIRHLTLGESRDNRQSRSRQTSEDYLSPLSTTSLESLVCDNCSLASIRPLFSISTLKTLHLRGSIELKSIEGIEKLPDLSSLSLSNAPLFDANNPEQSNKNKSSLSRLKQLEKLNLSVTGLTDIEFVRNFNRLTIFHAGFNQITDLSPMSELHHLEYSELSDNPVTSLQPLSQLRNIKILRFFFFQPEEKNCPLTSSQTICEFYPEMWVNPIEFPYF